MKKRFLFLILFFISITGYIYASTVNPINQEVGLTWGSFFGNFIDLLKNSVSFDFSGILQSIVALIVTTILGVFLRNKKLKTIVPFLVLWAEKKFATGEERYKAVTTKAMEDIGILKIFAPNFLSKLPVIKYIYKYLPITTNEEMADVLIEGTLQGIKEASKTVGK